MKTLRASIRPRVAALLAAMTAAILTQSAHAATLFWDTDSGTAGVGGTGTWDTSTTNWNSLATGLGSVSAWSNTTNAADTADFEGTGGTVTVDAGGVKAGQLAFNGSGNYTLSGGPITLTSTGTTAATSLFTGASTGTITINSNIVIDSTVFTGATTLAIQPTGSTNLTINGTLSFNYTGGTPTGAKTVSLRGGANSTITLAQAIGSPASGTTTALQVFGNSTSRTYLYGDNSALATSQIVGGLVLLSHNKAMGNTSTQLGISATVANSTAGMLTNGALTIANNLSIGSAPVSAQLIVGGDTAHVSEFTGTMAAGSSTQHLRFSAVSGGRVNFSGSITGTGTGTIIKQGAGVVAFTRAAGSTYARNTSVNAGALVLANTSGSATGTGTVTVADGATLAGTGFSTGAITASAAGSRFSAGDMNQNGVSSIGTLTLSGGLAGAGGATFDIDVNGASVDVINFGAGTLSLAGTQTFNITNLGTVQTGSAYTLFTGSGDWLGSVGATYVFNGPAGYVLDTTYGSGAGYIFDAAGHSLTVQFAAIPEPSTYAMLAGAGGLVVALRRRMRVRCVVSV